MLRRRHELRDAAAAPFAHAPSLVTLLITSNAFADMAA